MRSNTHFLLLLTIWCGLKISQKGQGLSLSSLLALALAQPSLHLIASDDSNVDIWQLRHYHGLQDGWMGWMVCLPLPLTSLPFWRREEHTDDSVCQTNTRLPSPYHCIPTFDSPCAEKEKALPATEAHKKHSNMPPLAGGQEPCCASLWDTL